MEQAAGDETTPTMTAPSALSYVGDVSQLTAELQDAASAMGEDVLRRVLACDSPRTGERVDAGRRGTKAVKSTWVGLGFKGTLLSSHTSAASLLTRSLGCSLTGLGPGAPT